MGIISNSAFSADTIRYELEKHGILPYFDLVISSCDYGIKKPSKYLYKVALQKLNGSAESSIFIGNKISTDIKGAENANIDGLLFDPKKKFNNQYKNMFSDYMEIIEMVR